MCIRTFKAWLSPRGAAYSPVVGAARYIYCTVRSPQRAWVMKRRTSRRHISARTIRRYRAIKNFVRRALGVLKCDGTSFQPDNKSYSSVSVSVLDLRQKIDRIEHKLNTVSKHCQDLASLESRLKLKDNLESEKDIDTKNNITQTKDIEKISQSRCNKPAVNKSTSQIINRDEASINISISNKMLDQYHSNGYKGKKKSKHKLDQLEANEKRSHRRKKHMVSRVLPANLPIYSSHSFNEPRNTRYLNAGCSEIRRHRNPKKIQYFSTNDGLNNHTEPTCGDYKIHRNKHLRPNLDQDFIADIIRRQYRPVKLFGKRESDFSQFSAPVCRDQDLSFRETILEGSDLCSCCHQEHGKHGKSKCICNNDLRDMRSICDTRLYSCKNHKHITNHAKHTSEVYNDSEIYDVVPVKEKCSPKSRRKFVEDNIMLMHDNYREVPPSPRTQRPQLNLQAQFQSEEDEDESCLEKPLKCRKKLQQKFLIQKERNLSNMSSEVFSHNKDFKCMQNLQHPYNAKPYVEECVGTTSNLYYPMPEQGVLINDTTLNTQTTDVSAEKTDKALSDIKDILQSFLQEIKKESSHSEKLNNSPTLEEPMNANDIQQMKVNNYNHNSNYGQCGVPPFMQPFPNSCCYPIVPMCPMNCMQNGFVVPTPSIPTPSITCAACVPNPKERSSGNNGIKKKPNETSSETQKLIKEIHKYISHNPNVIQKKEIRKNAETKPLITDNTCGSSKISKQDAKVGTAKLKCDSKSCEAIGSQVATNPQCTTNVSYSDTVLEKGSGEEITTESVSESVYSSEPAVVNKKKGGKFRNLLQSMGILKKNKSEVIEELTESNSSEDIEQPKPRFPYQSHPTPPYQQNIINYNMHEQRYFNRPPVPQQLHQHEYCAPHEPRPCYSPIKMDKKMNNKNSRGRQYHGQDMLAHGTPMQSPTAMCASYYDHHYGNMSPQVPVCLKEIEVKSTGTQSVRKISFLQKLTKKMQVPLEQAKQSTPKQSSTVTSKDKKPKDKVTPSLFDWKKIHEKAMQKTTDPLKYTYATQKKLAEGDNKMRNAMIKKLFYKRNPFSPRNLLVKTILGKDQSSFGEPPKMYKPRMFL